MSTTYNEINQLREDVDTARHVLAETEAHLEDARRASWAEVRLQNRQYNDLVRKERERMHRGEIPHRHLTTFPE